LHKLCNECSNFKNGYRKKIIPRFSWL